MNLARILMIFAAITLSNSLFAQKLLKGTVTDEQGSPIPFVKVYVKNSSDQRTISDVNGYYEMRLYPDEYFLVFNSTGYDTREAYVTISEETVIKNMVLFPQRIQDIEDMSVSAKKSNPGREIMLKVVKKRDQINPWNYPHTVHCYIKATEKIERKEKENQGKKDKKKKNKKNEHQEESNTDPSGVEDPFAEKRRADEKLAGSMNLVEVDLTRHFGGGNNVKEIRNAFDQRGSKWNRLYYTTTVKSNFNFFKNLLHLNDLHQTPISSPISGPGILSYKYRLEKQYEENGRKIHQIKIIPRNTATTTLEGYIYVIDSLWLIQKLELTMEKGNLLVYDYFTITQEFDHPGDSICVLKSQNLEYGVKFKNQSSTCTTVANFDNYDFSPVFPPKFFGNEVAVTEQEAYDKDSTYWKENRKVALTDEERAYIIVKDSIYDYQHRQEYLDSIDALFNKVTALKLLWWGIDHRNRPKKTQWTINSFAGLIRPIYIAGPRVAPGFFYFKKWDNERWIDFETEISYGFMNSDIKGSTRWSYRYNPFHFGTLNISMDHGFDAIRGYDAITQIYKRDNFIEVTDLTIGNNYELFNGFYLNTDFYMVERRSLEGYKFIEAVDSVLPNNDPTEFDTYQSFILDITMQYTPGQRYMREPHRKVVLGSKWPTFYLSYEKGIPQIFGSDVDHDYISGGVVQTFKIGTLGTSKYHVKTGLFLNTKQLKDADQKFHRRSDPIWFSNPLYSFQGLDSTLPTQKIFYEGHFVHHDNGSIINKIPFMKKTGIGLVVGAGALYVPEFDWQHYELLAGLERNFKFSKRRLRIGVYGVLSDGNHIDPTPAWKVSFAVLNNRNLKWNF
ncbi:MAG: carboxypeptidase-like regulatory domain-containing protein [Crocinitomicaceae bacterium]|nr:carboxypeptidase-like regulatory domain-containing protein [Crocinitomicaceae bacterium]